jgi:hypothetical protein
MQFTISQENFWTNFNVNKNFPIIIAGAVFIAMETANNPAKLLFSAPLRLCVK